MFLRTANVSISMESSSLAGSVLGSRRVSNHINLAHISALLVACCLTVLVSAS